MTQTTARRKQVREVVFMPAEFAPGVTFSVHVGPYDYVASHIAKLPIFQHQDELRKLLGALRRAGVDVELLECALGES